MRERMQIQSIRLHKAFYRAKSELSYTHFIAIIAIIA